MRPVPARRHHWALLALAGVVALSAFLSGHDGTLTGEQNNLLAELYKSRDPGLYPTDGLFANSAYPDAWRLNLPAWNNLLYSAVQVAGADEPAGGFRLLGAAALSLFLLGMYMLIYRQTHSTSSATLGAIISMAVFFTSRPFWGMGPLFTVTPATVYLAVVPLIVLAFMRSIRRERAAWVCLAAGLAGNIHLWSAVNLVLVLVLTLLVVGRFRAKTWLMAFVCLAAAAIGAAPAIWHYAAMPAPAGQTPATYATAWEAMRASGQNLLFPNALEDLLRALPLVGVLMIPTAVVLIRAGRFRVLQFGGWVVMLGAVLFVALGLHGLMQLIAWKRDTLPPLGFYEALRLAMLPMYILFAQAMVHLLRLAQTHRPAVRAGLIAFVVVFMGTSYNTRQVRYWAQDIIADWSGQERPGNRRYGDDWESAVIGRWLHGSGRAAGNALVFTWEPEARSFGRRSMWCGQDDMRYYYYLAPGQLQQWADNVTEQRRLLRPPDRKAADAQQVVRFVDWYWAQRPGPAAETFLVFPANSAPPADPRLQLVEVKGAGNYWKLYRCLPEPTTQPLGPPIS